MKQSTGDICRHLECVNSCSLKSLSPGSGFIWPRLSSGKLSAIFMSNVRKKKREIQSIPKEMEENKNWLVTDDKVFHKVVFVCW